MRDAEVGWMMMEGKEGNSMELEEFTTTGLSLAALLDAVCTRGLIQQYDLH